MNSIAIDKIRFFLFQKNLHTPSTITKRRNYWKNIDSVKHENLSAADKEDVIHVREECVLKKTAIKIKLDVPRKVSTQKDLFLLGNSQTK